LSLIGRIYLYVALVYLSGKDFLFSFEKTEILAFPLLFGNPKTSIFRLLVAS
jgi:hypothetical protein